MRKEKIKYKIARKVMVVTALFMLAEIIYPTAAFALTSGPAQPEFSSFEPIATTNMVNDFSGDFTYNLPVLNIPGANGGGYALSLSYHSGASPEEEASWVGYGWTLNPGSINRGKKGFPDDFKGKQVKYWNKTPANWTVTLGGSLTAEAFSKDMKNLSPSASASLRYNNYKGFGKTTGVNLSFAKGLVSLGYNVSDGDGSFSAQVNPLKALGAFKKKKDEDEKEKQDKYTLKDGMKKAKDEWGNKDRPKTKFNTSLRSGLGNIGLAGSNYGIFSHSGVDRPTTLSRYKGASYNVSFGMIGTPFALQLGANVTLSGSYSRQENINSSGNPNAPETVNAYGYMYSANATSNDQMDYYTEKDNPYDKRDYYLGLPFSNADNFMVTGEGLGGGFRLYNKTAGHYRPRQITSNMRVFNVGAEVEAGFNIGGGSDLGVGFQRFSSAGWNNSGGFSSDDTTFATVTDEPYFFRFNNDKGGYFDFKSDNLQQAKVKKTSGFVGNKRFNAELTGITTTSNSGIRSGRSSYIAYHTNAEMTAIAKTPYYKSYNQSNDTRQFVTRNNTNAIKDQVGELAVFNEDGTRYVYGLPVYSRNEASLQFDLEGLQSSKIINNYLAYKDVTDVTKLKTKVGEENSTPYASSYLLTEITSTDYVDLTMNGPTDDDFGGYTRFSYRRIYGTDDKEGTSSPWYRWRMPYNGLTYSRGQLSTQRDDMGSVNYGEKEVYYLDTIITKTHYAVFYVSDRADGRDANALESTASSSSTAQGSNKLKKLDAIKVFAKGSNQLIQTVRFEYYGETDASTLCKNLPNGNNGTAGKLTLKKVWFEYEGAFNAKISPYEFEYTYPSGTTYDGTKYTSLDGYGSGKTENPNYGAHNLDAWGNYQDDGANRYANMKPWLDQDPVSTFDPAAWQLKVIKLPSGGEIHVQYEQDDYLFVQDKHAEAMVRIASYSAGKYYLDISDAFGSLTTAEKEYIRDKILRIYKDGDKKMYFKFLYKLIVTAPAGDPTISSCASEYITGYVNVKKADIDGTGLYIELGKTGLSGNFNLPHKVCRDFVKKERLGMLNSSGVCDASAAGLKENSDPKQVVEQLLAFAGTNLIPGDGELCTEINNSLSYFRIPVPAKGKKGGGIRVKRLLMYDSGIETGDKALFGNEYSYKELDGSSSGVATNEPGAIREENALIEFDPRLKQKFLDKIISGRDRDQSEKPLGESILPSASVGYSRVIITNIHTGKTNTGFAVKEFYTAKDYPVKVEYTRLDNDAKDYVIVPGGLINIYINNLWLSQGFTCKLNEMHGQVKRDATYGGDVNDPSRARLSTETYYEYVAPGDQVQVMTDAGQVSLQNLGKETELVLETRGMEEISHDIGIEFDLSVGFTKSIPPIPIPQFTTVPSYTYTESRLYTHATNKIIQYPALQKKVRTYAEGIYHISENLAYNPLSGQPVMVKTYDGYNNLDLQQSTNHKGYWTSVTVPAATQYPGMGQKARNERMVLKSGSGGPTITKEVASGKYYLNFSDDGYNECDFISRFCPGDLVKLYKLSDKTNYGIFHVTDSVVGTSIYLQQAENFDQSAQTTGIGQQVIVEVLRSGCTNQLNVPAGNFTTYGESNILATNYMGRTALAAYMNTLLPSGTIPAADKFFRWYPDLKAQSSAWNNECRVFRNENGSFDPNTTIFANSSGNITFTVSATSFTVTVNRGNGSSASCNFNCGGDPAQSTQGGKFFVGTNGELQFGASDGSGCICTFTITCLDFCPDNSYDKATQVVATSAQTFEHNWPFDNTVYASVATNNDYENASKGKWRTKSNFVYRDSIIGANAGTQRNYKKAGVFEMKLFKWKDATFPTGADTNLWVKTSTVTGYSPDGNALEEKDIFNIYSAAKFGYDKTQPYLIAKNSPYQSVHFEGFEKAYSGNTKLEDGWSPSGIASNRVTTKAHSGKYSWKQTNGATVNLKSMKADAQLLSASSGLLLKVWVSDASNNNLPIDGTLTDGASKTMNITFTKVARTGEWTLYESRITGTSIDATFNSGDTFYPTIHNRLATDIYLDDVRVQPLDAQATCYVYDTNTLRLIASFDDQHFGLYYQYNGEGKLVRKQVETERGVKTITETQYHEAAQKTR